MVFRLTNSLQRGAAGLYSTMAEALPTGQKRFTQITKIEGNQRTSVHLFFDGNPCRKAELMHTIYQHCVVCARKRFSDEQFNRPIFFIARVNRSDTPDVMSCDRPHCKVTIGKLAKLIPSDLAKPDEHVKPIIPVEIVYDCSEPKEEEPWA